MSRRGITFTLATAAGGLLAAGLGMGAALAAAPLVASADSSTDWLSSIDQLLGGLSTPATTSSLDMQVSIDGMDLFPAAGNTATATSDAGSIAIAIGNGADAYTDGGIGNFAFADGVNSIAEAGGSYTYPFPLFGGQYFTVPDNFDVAYVLGTGSTAVAGGGEAVSSFDLASVSGDLLTATASSGSGLVDIVP